jgi:outer membrane protein OmpU
MKKVLLATSILAMSTGFAAAEVALSGSARMGIIYDDVTSDTSFSSRVRIVFTASGETDGGLAFGASMRADQNGGNASGTDNGDSTVFISGAFGKLTMGDVSGAADALVGQTSGIGYGPNDGLHEIGFIGTDKTAAYYEYSAGALTFGLGFGQPSGGGEMNVGVKYAAGNYSVAIGYEESDTADLLSVGASATFGAATVKARVSDGDAGTPYSLSLDYAMGATTITLVHTDFDDIDGTTHTGIGAAYDLGGGATLAGGIMSRSSDGTIVPVGGSALGDATFADVGIKFSF